LDLHNGDHPLAAQWLRRPEAKLESLLPWLAESGAWPANVLMTVETEFKYAGYLDQQLRQIERLGAAESRLIPDRFEFEGIPGLSREVCQKLQSVRPSTLGQASRIPGVTPAAVAILDCYLSLGDRT
jgi:tRNA uridine 5-carboxymethylaminomethyl modification enzyme